MSAALKKMLTGIQPIELNATTRLFASQASIRLVAVASICREVLRVDEHVAAGRHGAVLDPRVVALERMVFVAITPPMPSHGTT